MASAPAWANQPLSVVYPPNEHQTTSERIFLIGTAPPDAEVTVNGQAIARSRAGHFAPSFPLQLGDNVFTLRYQNQQVQVKVTRLSTTPKLPVGLAFAQDSLTPAVDVARLPGELICFSAIAPPKATVAVQIANQKVPLLPQSQIQLPPNSAALTQQNQPTEAVTGQYQGCTTLPDNNINTVSNSIQPQFQLTVNGKTTTQPSPGKISILSPAQLEVAEVIADAGVARTGPSTDYSRLTPLPKGTRASITAKEGEWLRLDYGGWINGKETRIVTGAVPPRSLIRSVSARQVAGATEIVFPLQVPVPVSVQQGDRTLTLTLYNTTAQTDVIRLDDNPLISRLDWQQIAPEQLQYTLNIKSAQQWGYKLRYDGTSLILALPHPPSQVKNPESSLATSHQPLTTLSQPLAGIKILLDPGHGGAELGARGPNGYPEKEINLVISKLVRDQLVARGATVYMTREEDTELSLGDRVAMIDKLEPAIALSLHYNALPDSGDAINTQGFGAFWYHPQAHNLAVFLHNYVVNKLQRPSYGVYWNNLALTRPASAPSVLLELGFMINPTEFEWIVDPQAQQRLAEAIAQGITEWFSRVQS
ncbi:N-acetylmuramoyl-L-alanine amidase [Gloeocapsopsis crepidinum LEGE 06123]|uniref:N-acetylmuramoyl-L-alanine amidase n=1 Tax=Gloeocapsopsis crepidinum LEGE 06123 TaxID=588587 RepID=A0ABR9UXB2_9CHRO|nr:N-acetylmuramoyl-L-alanine amidase [Gloeocapsopsis crepidinum LEGE 06123]